MTYSDLSLSNFFLLGLSISKLNIGTLILHFRRSSRKSDNTLGCCLPAQNDNDSWKTTGVDTNSESTMDGTTTSDVVFKTD